MNNSRLTAKERNLVKGAIRRVFARSELHRNALNAAKVVHSDPERPRVKTWYKCKDCGVYEAQHKLAVDHRVPVVPIDRRLEDMTWDELVERLWCDPNNLDILCKTCHDNKSAIERKERKKFFPPKKKGAKVHNE